MRLVILAVLLFAALPPLLADEGESTGRLYTTREERRESGIRHELTDWLSVSGLLELEALHRRSRVADGNAHDSEGDFDRTLQLAALFEPLGWLKGEVIYEYESEEERHQIDEAFLSAEAGDFEIEAGRIYVPFGVYYSNFVTGPVLEFGETRSDGLIVSGELADGIDLSGFVFRGDAEKTGDGSDVDWGLAIEGVLAETGTFAVSYLSDLAESLETPLEVDDHHYARRVDAMSANLILGLERFELSVEFLMALRASRELDAASNRPQAWNVELGYYPEGSIDWAFRIEGSRELEDEPEYRFGPAMAWRFLRNASITVEYLYSTYDPELVTDNQDRGLDDTHELAMQVSVEF